MAEWWRGGGGGGGGGGGSGGRRWWGWPARLFLFSENPFAKRPHVLSAKSSSPVERRREAVAESFLSVKASPREKTHSARVTSLSAKGLNPVVKG
jgi:hypothetical protein